MILALLKLMRLYYALPLAGGFIIIVAYLTGGNIFPICDKIILSFFSLISIISAGYVLNDLCDIAVDAINCPDRVMPKGQLSKTIAALYAIILFLIGLTLAAFCNIHFLLLMIAVVAGLTFYNFFSKKMGFFKDILAAGLATMLYPLAFALTDAAQTPRLKSLFIFPIWFFLTAIGYEILKDIRDEKGDRNIKSIFTINYKLLPAISRTMILLAGLIAFLPFFFGYCKYIYLVTAAIALVLAILAAMNKPAAAIRYIYLEVLLITLGSLADLLAFGS